MLIRVFLHAEFISAMKTSSKSYDSREKCKKIEKLLVLVISVNFFEIFTETLEQNIRKSHKKMFFRWKRRQINKNEQFSNF